MHFAELGAHSASVHGEEIRKLLAVERYCEGRTARLLCHDGEVVHQLLPRRALRHMSELGDEAKIVFGKRVKKILHDHGMESARR